MKAPRALWKHACFRMIQKRPSVARLIRNRYIYIFTRRCLFASMINLSSFQVTDILPLDGIHKKERSYEQRFPMTYPEKFQGIAVVGDREWKNPKKISYEPKPFYPEDVEIKVEACGVCGSDIHCVAGHWGPRNDPLVAGHEIVGRIVRVGRRCSSQLKIGMRVGMGAIAFSCLKCSRCKKGEENYCPKMLLAYNYMYDDGYVSQGGYASHVRVDGRFVVPIPDGIPSYLAAPLMCGGITAYAPLLRHGCGPGKKVGIAGIGGIGHMGITFAKFMGAEVYAFSRRSSKKKDAMKMGADYFIATLEEQNDWAEELFDTLDILLICTNSFSELDLDKLIKIMKKGGSIVTIAEPPKEEMLVLKPFGLLGISLESSSVGTFEEIKQLLQLVSDNNLKIWVEKYPVSEKGVAAAFDRMDKGEARYRIALVDYEKEFPI